MRIIAALFVVLVSFCFSCKEECGNCVIVDDYGHVMKRLDCETTSLSECNYYKDTKQIDGQCSCTQ